MRRWRTGALAVDNSGELPTALPFDHKLHRLRLPVQLQKNPTQTRPHKCGVNVAQTGQSTLIADGWGTIEPVTQGTFTGCPPSMECAATHVVDASRRVFSSWSVNTGTGGHLYRNMQTTAVYGF